MPNKGQKWLWSCWCDYWNWIEELVEKTASELWCVYNGDLVDGGDHHGTRQCIAAGTRLQHKIAESVFAIPQEYKPKHQFVVKGTPIHGGHQGEFEDWIGDNIKAEIDKDTGQYAWWHLPLEARGTLLDFQHHGRKGYRPWTSGNAANNIAAEITYRYATAERMPDVAVRSHVHTSSDSFDNHPVRAIVTPAWQLKTEYAHRVVPEATATVGGLAIICYTDGGYEVEKKFYEPGKAKIWKA